MICRYILHAGMGRSWQVDPSLPEYEHMGGHDLKPLVSFAQSMQDDVDWWIIFDADDGMSHCQGWSTGRTTPHLREADRAHTVLRTA